MTVQAHEYVDVIKAPLPTPMLSQVARQADNSELGENVELRNSILPAGLNFPPKFTKCAERLENPLGQTVHAAFSCPPRCKSIIPLSFWNAR